MVLFLKPFTFFVPSANYVFINPYFSWYLPPREYGNQRELHPCWEHVTKILDQGITWTIEETDYYEVYS